MSDKPLSLRAYAKRVGVSVEAVSKAVTSGRLSGSVVRDERGAPKIGDVELADREWAANTRPRVDYPPVAAPPPPDAAPSPPKPTPKPDAIPRARARPTPAPPPPSGDVPDYNVSRAMREAHAARREAAMADKAELEVAEMRGDLVAVDEVRRDVEDIFVRVKTKILAVPSRAAQRLPKLAHEIVPVLDELLREVLTEIDADENQADDEEAE